MLTAVFTGSSLALECEATIDGVTVTRTFGQHADSGCIVGEGGGRQAAVSVASSNHSMCCSSCLSFVPVADDSTLIMGLQHWQPWHSVELTSQFQSLSSSPTDFLEYNNVYALLWIDATRMRIAAHEDHIMDMEWLRSCRAAVVDQDAPSG